MASRAFSSGQSIRMTAPRIFGHFIYCFGKKQCKLDKTLTEKCKSSFEEQILGVLPFKPYCVKEKGSRLTMSVRQKALHYPYIQFNTHFRKTFIILDLDYENALTEIVYCRIGLPLPNFVVANFDNGKAHAYFKLKYPIIDTRGLPEGSQERYEVKYGRKSSSNDKPQKSLNFYNHIKIELTEAFDADRGYAGLLSKNPVSPNWRTTHLRDEPYTLYELAQILKIPPKREDPRKELVKFSKEEAKEAGRNCYVFYTACEFAYLEVRKFRGKTYAQWQNTMIDHCLSINEGLTEPLDYNEIKNIAKSISRYCWKKDSYCYQEFIDRQTRKGSLGGKKGGAVRSSQFEPLRKEAKKLKEEGLSIRKIAETLKVSKTSVSKWLKEDK